MSDLPEERVEPTAPFSHVGMDVFGPFICKDVRREVKRYGLIFTCLSSRAVHLELLDDMTSDCFINSLRCLIAIRGPVQTLLSDQGTNFMGAKGELDRSQNDMIDEKTKEFLKAKSCTSNSTSLERVTWVKHGKGLYVQSAVFLMGSYWKDTRQN